MKIARDGDQTILTMNDDEMGTVLQALVEASLRLREKSVPDLYFGPMAEFISMNWSFGPIGGVPGPLPSAS